MKQLTIVELNEVNFDYVRAYGKLGRLPTLNALVAKHGLTETTSEQEYDDLEPWIQWVSAHTGKPLAEHGVFRLGDIVEAPNLVQIWETIEKLGYSIGAVSPMNARNACREPAFFLPDPWTQTALTAPPLMRKLFSAIAQVVNDNASAKVEKTSLAWLSLGLARFARPRHYTRYLSLAAEFSKKPWNKAIMLDLLISDLFYHLQSKHQPNFSTVFMNAAAHIQHHYMFNSLAYPGDQRNPSWYIDEGHDPVLDIYQLYDDLVAGMQKDNPDRRIMIATGLHQVAYGETLFYWRLQNHHQFLTDIGVPFERVEPRMSRDFVVYCENQDQAIKAESRLCDAFADDGTPLFSVDNRNESLFVTLTYPSDISENLAFRVGTDAYPNLKGKCAFVAIKNGEHDGIGYLIDTARQAGDTETRNVPIGSMFSMVEQHFLASPERAVA